MFLTKIKSMLTAAIVLAFGAGLLDQTQAQEQPKDSVKVVRAPQLADEKPAKPMSPGETSPKNVKPEPKVLTPEEAIKPMLGKAITVKFKVNAVQTMRVSESSEVGRIAGYHEVFFLKGSDSLSVQIIPPAMDTITRLGIPDKHFTGKVVQVTGRLGPGPGLGIGPTPNGFQIVVTDLTQIEVVGE